MNKVYLVFVFFFFFILNKVNDNVNCSCGEHHGKEMLNKVFNVNVNYLFELVFGHTEHCRRYWETQKMFNAKIEDWKVVDNCPWRLLEYNVDLGALGKPKNTEEQV